MIRALTIALAAILLVGGAAEAKNYKSHGGGGAGAAGCPPGLAKKNPPCVPPGLAKKGDFYYNYDYEDIDWHDRRDEWRDKRYDFYRIGDIVVSADRKTGKILHLFDQLGNIID